MVLGAACAMAIFAYSNPPASFLGEHGFATGASFGGYDMVFMFRKMPAEPPSTNPGTKSVPSKQIPCKVRSPQGIHEGLCYNL